MTRTLLWLAVAAVVTAAAPRSVEAQCRGLDSLGTQMVGNWRNLMVNPNPQVRAWLQQFGIAQVDSATVVLVSDKTACSKALKSYNASLGPGSQPPSGSVYVVKVGTMYVVRDPVQKGGGWYHDVVLDNRFFMAAKFMG